MAERQAKNVKFSSSSSRSSQGHHRSDSGVAQDVEEQRNSVPALQEALDTVSKRLEHYKAKAKEIDAQLSEARREQRDTEARNRALLDRARVLEDENRRLAEESQQLRRLEEENRRLRDETRRLLEERDRAWARGAMAAEGPVMSGARPATPPDSAKLHRSSSRRRKEDPEREKEKEKAKLAKRFERHSSDDGEASSSKPPRTRRESYVEPFGPGASRQAGVPPPSPTRMYTTYSPSVPMGPPAYTTHLDPAYSTVPRSVAQPLAPVVVMPHQPTPGDYVSYPLPERKAKDRR